MPIDHPDKSISKEELKDFLTLEDWLRSIVKPEYWPKWLKEETHEQDQPAT